MWGASPAVAKRSAETDARCARGGERLRRPRRVAARPAAAAPERMGEWFEAQGEDFGRQVCVGQTPACDGCGNCSGSGSSPSNACSPMARLSTAGAGAAVDSHSEMPEPLAVSHNAKSMVAPTIRSRRSRCDGAAHQFSSDRFEIAAASAVRLCRWIEETDLQAGDVEALEGLRRA